MDWYKVFILNDLEYIFNPCRGEYIKMSRPLTIFSQSDYLIQVVDTVTY